MLYVTVPGLLAVFAVLSVGYLYRATQDIARDLSPQGCRMSHMYESYVLHSAFNEAWTPLAKRYSLWLYREVDERGTGKGWEPTHVTNGAPVLFIPGNAGSLRQVRSIASSATRQYFEAPHSVAPEFRSRGLKPLDFFAVEFNEDLSAFHGPTLEAQTAYTARAVAYILSLYPPDMRIIVMGHSMGGVVATSLLPALSGNITAILTMSTPHTLPPARFDARVDMIYDKTRRALRQDETPIVSLCGGATDMMIPSEACVLPSPDETGSEGTDERPFRRTVFSSALEGAWTGVGHQEMVWCHQVRWRVARAALELGAMKTPAGRGAVLDRWLRDGHALPPSTTNKAGDLDVAGAEIMPEGTRSSCATYAGRAPTCYRFLRRVPRAPQKPGALSASVFACFDTTSCITQAPSVLKLLPSPIPGRPFPVPHGTDESEGVVLFEAEITDNTFGKWIGVRMEHGQGEGWIVGGFVDDRPFVSSVSTLQLLFGQVSVPMPELGDFRASFEFPRLLSNALIVYQLTPRRRTLEEHCEPLFAPLLVHTSQLSETHYFSLTVPPTNRTLLHSHGNAPYVRTAHASPYGLRFSVYSSGPQGCRHDLVGLDLGIDWSATLGRWASRYFSVLPVWTVGVVALIIFQAWGASDAGAPVPTVEQSIATFMGTPLRRMLLISVLLSAVPLGENLYLGNRGEPLLFPVAPLLLLISSSFVSLSWWILKALLWPLGKFSRVGRRRRKDTAVHRNTVISMCMILLIFLFVPLQVAFLGCWTIHLYNCAASQVHIAHLASISDTGAIPLLRHGGEAEGEPPEALRRPQAGPPPHIAGNHNHSMHLLLLLTWLLPLAAPALVVWVRMLASAGLTTPFDGDHFVLRVAPFLVLVDFASWTNHAIFERQSFGRVAPIRWAFAALAATAFLLGARKAYLVFDVAEVTISLAVLIRIEPRYWGRSSWSPTT